MNQVAIAVSIARVGRHVGRLARFLELGRHIESNNSFKCSLLLAKGTQPLLITPVQSLSDVRLYFEAVCILTSASIIPGGSKGNATTHPSLMQQSNLGTPG
jgi:hypothetical protein